MGIGLGIIIAVGVVLLVIILVGWFVGVYNGLVRLKNNIKKSWANIDVLLKQRVDELTKLMGSVKGYMKHEREVLTEITKARSAMMKAKTKPQKAAADNQLTGALKTLFAVAENYPQLQANQNFMQLQDRISGIENELADRREFYNDSVNTYNIKIKQIPTVFIANMLGYKEEEMFKAEGKDREDVKVEF
ncbi:TPA: LemA family protein [Candidatus Woesearchaeota archaeon]|nr:LemA family protein [Candidatus Woesearchaeota archaeon]